MTAKPSFFFCEDTGPWHCRLARRLRPLAALIVFMRASGLALHPETFRLSKWRTYLWIAQAYHWGRDFKC